MDVLGALFFVFDNTGRLVQWKEGARRVTGYADEGLRGLPVLPFCGRGDAKRVAADAAAAVPRRPDLCSAFEDRTAPCGDAEGEPCAGVNLCRIVDAPAAPGFTGSDPLRL